MHSGILKVHVHNKVDDFDKIDTILIESDDSFNQYKRAQHFYHLQSITNKFHKNLICVCSVAVHGKGEVDHDGGLAKVISVNRWLQVICSSHLV